LLPAGPRARIAGMERVRKGIFWAVIVSEFSHVFCCVLPTLFSLAGLLAGAGVLVAMPGPLVDLHDTLHAYEIPMIIGSGGILALGWALHALAARIDCHDTGCGHGPCTPGKRRAATILKIATILFVANVLVFLVFHRGMGLGLGTPEHPAHAAHHHDHHHHHGH
jgi:hypothetical protein